MDDSRTRRPEPTMRDVAALAGVSIKTVSRAVNGERGVGADVARRVAEAAAALGYRPNLSASSLRRADRRSTTLGVVFEDLSNPFDSTLLRAVEARARESGFLVFAGSDEDDPARQAEILESLALRRVDGLLAMPLAGHQDALRGERQRGVPMVLLDRPPTFPDTDCVTTTNRESTSEAVQRLTALGHRRIAFLGDRQELWTHQERHAGYVEGLARAGVRPGRDLVRRDLRGPEAAQTAVTDLLGLPEPPTAVFAAQNLLAIGAVRALQHAGLEHDVALVGFDDFPVADLLRPAVSVVQQDVSALGRTAADLVLARIAGDRSPAKHVTIPATLVPRGSGEVPPLRSARG
ncbi:LacI family transcriptional regulator [Kineococcus xinjiangensis]|uniref:LacI family transcriptional regulator n=1 Tax=Kineococcus xinjiangensis TaxID=512762 RepID=A0A2S6ITQ9_9ACTN|nr:LacI family DNA-binding transcriptional regulator [Kineococcus xinjiangensis]PPK97633.1 LacI family transcriptional regulator [Kineococcus xinjiangensis]